LGTLGGRDRDIFRYEQWKLEEEIEHMQGVHIDQKWTSFEGTTRENARWV
jgi:hypothetical protein